MAATFYEGILAAPPPPILGLGDHSARGRAFNLPPASKVAVIPSSRQLSGLTAPNVWPEPFLIVASFLSRDDPLSKTRQTESRPKTISSKERPRFV